MSSDDASSSGSVEALPSSVVSTSMLPSSPMTSPKPSLSQSCRSPAVSVRSSSSSRRPESVASLLSRQISKSSLKSRTYSESDSDMSSSSDENEEREMLGEDPHGGDQDVLKLRDDPILARFFNSIGKYLSLCVCVCVCFGVSLCHFVQWSSLLIYTCMR